MLYIFYVDTGATITFNIGLALQSVAELKEAIERECGVLAEHQVLLMSGGESLEPNARVCSYSAGTDTNPIYLFNQGAIESQVPPVPHTDYSTDVDLADQINASLAMSATYATLVSRAQLAQQCYNIAKEQTRTCEHLVHDQHLQQQGWAAVVANLEDITQMFQSRADLLQQSVAHYLTEREQHMQLLNNFNNDLQTLSKIPILPALRAQADGLLSPNDDNDDVTYENNLNINNNEKIININGVVDDDDDDEQQVLSLLRWISAKDNQSSLEQIFDQCSRGLEQFDERMMEALKNEVNSAIDASNMPELKEIKGLGERLFGLEQLMSQAKRLVQDQGELAQGFSQNQTRANNLGDPSVLPDLCASHRRQLIVMLGNHNQLRDIRRRCTRAKEELSENIYHRLKWIMFVEKKIWEVDGKLVMYHENLKRLRRHLEILQQIHLAPQMYINAVGEVVRRRTFSQAFLLWASNLACQLMTVHTQEVQRRRDFQNKFDGHFLNILFPGLEDIPPSFATQAPNIFDNELPKLTTQDMDSLKCQLPDFADSISTSNLTSITQFFLSNSLITDTTKNNNNNNDDDKKNKQDHQKSSSSSSSSSSLISSDQRMIDEEYNPDNHHDTKNQMDNLSKTREMEENLGNARSEVQRLRTILRTIKLTMDEAMTAFKNEIIHLKEKVNDDKNRGIHDVTERVGQLLSLHSQQCQRILHERQQEMTIDHELELADVKKLLNARDEEINNLKQIIIDKENNQAEHQLLINTMRQKLDADNEEIINIKNIQSQQQIQLADELKNICNERDNAIKKSVTMANNLKQCQIKITQLEDNLIVAKLDQQKMIKEATDKLQIEYKTELETIRSRFKLMTASTVMERSPSDSSLEKIERQDLIELVNHEAILAQTRQDFETEKDEAIRQAIEKETQNFQAKMQFQVGQLERQIESHMLRENSLLKECEQYRENIRQLNADENQTRKLLNDKLEKLEKEKHCLEIKINTEGQILKQHESLVHELKIERNELRDELNIKNNNKMEMTQIINNCETSTIPTTTTTTTTKTTTTSSTSTKIIDDTLGSILLNTSGNDDNIIEASESKKVRLESSDNNSNCLTRRLELLENDNKHLTAELRSIKDSKDIMMTRMELLESDKVFLEIELLKEQSRNQQNNYQPEIIVSMDSSSRDIIKEVRDKDMNSSVAIVSETSSQEAASCSSSSDINRQDATFRYREKLIKSTTNIFQQLCISLNSCNTGDTVIVLWDTLHTNYIVLQESRTMYFLHSDCIDTLDLRPGRDGLPKQIHVLGEVIDKQYCHAKKPENRYKVPQGTKFYRVRVKPLSRDLDLTISSSDKSQE